MHVSFSWWSKRETPKLWTFIQYDKDVLLPQRSRSGQECQTPSLIQSQQASALHSGRKKTQFNAKTWHYTFQITFVSKERIKKHRKKQQHFCFLYVCSAVFDSLKSIAICEGLQMISHFDTQPDVCWELPWNILSGTKIFKWHNPHNAVMHVLGPNTFY